MRQKQPREETNMGRDVSQFVSGENKKLKSLAIIICLPTITAGITNNLKDNKFEK
jgi:hypothetical protein